MNNDSLRAFIKPEHTRFFIQQMFKNVVDLPADAQIEIRKVGKSGDTDVNQSVDCQIVPQFGADADWLPMLAEWVCRRLEQSALAGVGVFMAPAILNDRRANDASVTQMVSVCADLDSGNPAEKLAAMNRRFGFRPTFVVESGGVTSEGHKKLHIHWRLSEPCNEPWRVAYIREQIAMQYGGDVSFKRIPQIIRIPGALYDKAGAYATTQIIEGDGSNEVDLFDFDDVLGIDWNNLDPQSMWGERIQHAKTDAQRKERLSKIQNEKIHEGGDDGDNRWLRFSEYAGHQIRQARLSMQSVEEAQMSIKLWVENNMVPAWADERVEKEFRALLQRDRVTFADVWGDQNKPAITFNTGMSAAPEDPTPTHPSENPAAAAQDDWHIDTFDVGSLYAGNAPPVKYLIDNFLIESAFHALVADGGVGKTYLGLELAMRVAAGPDLHDNLFMGFEVLKKGISIVFTVEDNQDDIHRRLAALDPHGDLRKAAAGRCFVIPVQDQIMGGLTLVERDSKGNYAASAAWNYLVRKIEDCYRKVGVELPVLVVLDTYSATHHGDENTSTGTNEWFRAAGLLKKFNAAVMIMHHVKKANPDVEIKTPSDMKNNIRGSSAFVNSCRVVFGTWEMPNSDSVLKELPKESEARLFNMGLLKNNTGIDWSDRSDPRYKEPMITLRRTGSGQLVYDAMIHQTRIDLTHGKRERMKAKGAQLKAAILHSCRWHAENAWAITERLLSKEPDRFLPAAVNDAPAKDIRKALVQLVKDGSLKELKIKARGGTFTIYDVPDGTYSKGQQVDRAKETPVLNWHAFRYDEDHVEYVKAEDLPSGDPDTVYAQQHRMEFNGYVNED